MEFWDTPIFALVALEYPDLVWRQDEVVVQAWGGATLSRRPVGPLTTL